MSLIRLNPRVSAESMAHSMKISSRAVEKQIAKLKKDGRLKRVGSAKGGYWEILN